jgi:hypothetical protein
MAYTIKGLAKANECESLDCYGLASIWDYWLTCNCNDRQSVNDFFRLRKADRKEMLSFMKACGFIKLYEHILEHIC